MKISISNLTVKYRLYLFMKGKELFNREFDFKLDRKPYYYLFVKSFPSWTVWKAGLRVVTVGS